MFICCRCMFRTRDMTLEPVSVKVPVGKSRLYGWYLSSSRTENWMWQHKQHNWWLTHATSFFLRNPWMQAQTIPPLRFCQIIHTKDLLLFSNVFENFGQIFGRMSCCTHLNEISSQNWHWTWTKTTEQNNTDCFSLFRSRSAVELWIVSVILSKRSDPI